MDESRSRRAVLGLAGVGLGAMLAGCSLSSSDGARYSLMGSPRGGTSLVDLFEWEPRLSTLHVRRHADALTAELLDSGTVATEAQPLAPYEPDGPVPPAYAERDGAYYRVRVTDVETVTLDRWELWFEPVDEAPADATVEEEPAEGLSEFDAEIVSWAIGEAIGAIVDDTDLGSAPHGERGVVYFEPMDPDESALVPDPPFEYVRVEPDTEFLDEPQTLRAHAERGSLEATRYVNEATRVADSRSALTEILAGNVDASFDDAPDGVREIVAEVSTGSGIHAEREPISDAFRRVFERLGVDDPAPPADADGSRSWQRYYEYGGRYYGGSLRIRND